MSRESIANALKLYRKKNNYKVSDVVVKLGEHGKHVAEKTVYGWESGQALPDGECLVALCSIYNIHDVPYVFGNCDASDVIHPTAHEAKVIKMYRAHTDMQPAVDKLLGVSNTN
ncbi:MAG: helix-turn-helix domain-containing protein [Lachnospiraceae bacterium]|nr:helix-turn-helix domain-containing protein [Lachnospiraceae bacterium]